MRAIMLLGISVLLAVAIGCVEDAAMSGYATPPPASRNGVSLEPLSIPPPPRTVPAVAGAAPATYSAQPVYTPSPDSPYAPLYGGYAVSTYPAATAAAPELAAIPGPPPVQFDPPGQPQVVLGEQPVAYISEPYTLPTATVGVAGTAAPVYPAPVLVQGPTVTYDATSYPVASAPAPVYIQPTVPVTVDMRALPPAGGPVVSTPIGSNVVMAPPATTFVAAPAATAAADASGFQLVPALDIQPGIHPGDPAPSQWFEVIRPGNGPIRIGRISSTCVCVSPRIPTRYINAGERALIECRIVDRPAVNNVTYGLYVSILEPVTTTLDADITVSY